MGILILYLSLHDKYLLINTVIENKNTINNK